MLRFVVYMVFYDIDTTYLVESITSVNILSLINAQCGEPRRMDMYREGLQHTSQRVFMRGL